MGDRINMSEGKIYVALDLGSSKTSAIIAETDSLGKIHIIGVETTEKADGVERGSIQNPSLAADDAKIVLDKIRNYAVLSGKKITSVVIGLTGYSFRTLSTHTAASHNNDMELTKEMRKELEQDAAEKLQLEEREHVYEMIDQEFEMDNGIVDAKIGSKFQEIDARYIAIVGRVGLDSRIDEVCQELSLENIRFFGPSQTAMAAINDTERELGCAVIDFGAQTTSVVVIEGNKIRHAAVIPVGGQTVTRDLKSLLILEKSAEKLKKQYGYALVEKANESETKRVIIPEEVKRNVDLRDVSKIIEAREDEILDMVCGEIDKSGYWGKLKSGIVITGGASKMNSLKELISLKTGMTVRDADWKHLVSTSTNEMFICPENAMLIGLVNSAILANSDDCVASDEKKKIEDVATTPTESKTAKTPKKPTKEKKKNFVDNLTNMMEGLLFDNDKL